MLLFVGPDSHASRGSAKMHQPRRRKKRPSYGVRTVEISRGKNGFGFTISGQAPCILSCIVNGSPAEKAGLRPGDFLIAVNGANVSKALHDDVVRLMAATPGVLKLQIAENYYSDSSDEEIVPCTTRAKPKYPHRLRNRHHQNGSRAEKVVRDLQTGALFIDHLQIATQPDGSQKPCLVVKRSGFDGAFRLSSRSNKALLDLILQQKLKEVGIKPGTSRSSNDLTAPSYSKQRLHAHGKRHFKAPKRIHNVASNGPGSSASTDSTSQGSSSARVFSSVFSERELNNILYPSIFQHDNVEEELDDETHSRALLRAVVGYLGTIEMPKEPQLPSSRLQAIRNCIRRLRIEKKIHTLVLLSVFPESVLLTNPHGLMLAEFPAEKITFSGVYADDKKFFGLVTSHGASSDELSEGSQEGPVSISSSCHVFLVDPKLQPHHTHLKRAKAFRITCTPHPLTNRCREFPESADVILQAIVGLYRNRMGLNVDASAVGGLVEFNGHVVSPQPSNTSSNSSNSDSGIGFRDEGNTSDRVFVVDVENYNRYRTNSLDRQSFSVPNYSLLGGSGVAVPGGSAAYRTCNAMASQHPNFIPTEEEEPTGLMSSNQTREVTEEEEEESSETVRETPECVETPKPAADAKETSAPATSTDRLTVRVMPDPPSADKPSPPRATPVLPTTESNLRPGVTQRTCASPNTVTPKAEKSTGAIPKNRAKTGATPPSPVKDLDSRLSPKVYDLELPVTGQKQQEQQPGAAEARASKREQRRNFGETFQRRIKSSAGSRSLDDLHLQPEESELDSCEVFLYRRHKVNGQDPSPYVSKDDSDSQVEYSFEATRKWARTSSLRRHLRRKRSVHRTSHDAGTMSDGEIANSSIGVSSSSSILGGLDHVSDTASSGNLGMAEVNDYGGSERAVDVGRVGSWAAGFNHLLQDPAGLHTFSEFLKKEFSQENILFWISCERYRKLSNAEEMNNVARELYVKHLSVGALEPVNVDSHARQTAQEGLQKPTRDIFLPAQKQIFNLMKFDCYQRFLKSQLFKECMMLEMQGRPLPYNGEDAIVMSLAHCTSEPNLDGKMFEKGSQAVLRSKEDPDERKRKSLLPWGRNKSKQGQGEGLNVKLKGGERNSILRRSNKKKKKEPTKTRNVANDDAASDISGSRSSLASSEPSSGGVVPGITHSASKESLNSVDLSSFPGQCGGRDGGCHLCRVILPDRSTTVVKTQSGESIAVMLQRLLERRNLTYTAIDAYVAGSDKAIDQNLDVASLGCKEIRVEQRVLFRLDLPKDKTVGVKAKPGRVCGDALTPILLKYGLKMEDVFMRVAGSNRPVVYSTPVHTIDNQRIIVKLKEDFQGWDDDNNNNTTDNIQIRHQIPTPVSDDVTNRIFELLLKGKSQHQLDELGIVDFVEGGRKRYGIIDTRNSGGLTNLGRRNSVGGEKSIPNGKAEKSKAKLQEIERDRARKLAVGAMPDISRMSLLEALSVRAHSPPTQQFVQNLVAGKSNRKDLLEVWKRAQSSRLDDQRGTEINSELPDFLKVNKEKLAGKENCLKGPSKRPPYKGSKDKLDLSRGGLMNHYRDQDISPLRCIDSSFITDGILPTALQAEEYFSTTHIYRPSLELANNSGYRRNNDSSTLSDMRLSPSVGLGAYAELRTRSASCIPGQNGNAKRIPQRPASNPLPHLMYPRPPPTRRSPEFYPYEQYFCGNLRSSEGLDNLLMSSMEGLDLDFDLDVTLKASPPTTSDDSFTPTKTVQTEDGNFSTPTALDPTLRQFVPPPNGRRFKTDPPPLPPKVKTRGPPPRPPSRQQLNVTPSFGQSSSDDHYNSNIGYAGIVQDVFRRKSKQADSNSHRNDKFNISFV